MFNISKSTIESFMAWNGKPVSSGLSLCGVLCEAVQKALDMSEARAMEVIKRRVAHLAHNKDVVGDFMFLDEAQANLDQADKKEARDVKRKLKDHAAQHQELLAEFKERKARPSTGKKGKMDILNKYKGPKHIPGALDMETLLQRYHKQFMPPDSYLWVDRGGQAWLTRVPPLKALPRYWRREGSESQALFMATKDAWTIWLQLEGIDASECPV